MIAPLRQVVLSDQDIAIIYEALRRYAAEERRKFLGGHSIPTPAEHDRAIGPTVRLVEKFADIHPNNERRTP